MKLQRYDFRATDVMLGECEDGDFVRYEDYAALEAENEALCAEIERLKAPPKVLSAEEVTEPGFYWHRHDERCEWRGKYGPIWIGENDVKQTGQSCLKGQFIGPLTPPEV